MNVLAEIFASLIKNTPIQEGYNDILRTIMLINIHHKYNGPKEHCMVYYDDSITKRSRPSNIRWHQSQCD